MTLPDFTQPSEDFKRIEKAIQFIEANFKSQPTLEQIANSVCLSKYHFDRLFKRWAGISPKRFLQFLTLNYTKQKLARSENLLDTALDAGLSGPSRLHDLFVTFEAITPGEFKQQGAGLKVTYGVASSPFGDCLLAQTGRGICYLGFIKGSDRNGAFTLLHETYPKADFSENTVEVAPAVARIFRFDQTRAQHPFNLHIKGTNFQINVWKALLAIPDGWVVSYQDIAAHMGRPRALRAVANAVAINPVAYLIPCHRVIAKSGEINRYRWGASRKKALIGWEAARAASPSSRRAFNP